MNVAIDVVSSCCPGAAVGPAAPAAPATFPPAPLLRPEPGMYSSADEGQWHSLCITHIIKGTREGEEHSFPLRLLEFSPASKFHFIIALHFTSILSFLVAGPVDFRPNTRSRARA